MIRRAAAAPAPTRRPSEPLADDRTPGTGTRLDLARWLVQRTRTLLAPLVVAVLARIANQLLGVALLVIAATAISHAAAGTAVSVPGLIAWLVGLSLAKALLRYLEHYAGHWVAFSALQRLRELFFARIVPQAPAATTGRAGAELTERATRDIDRIEVFFAHTVPPAISAVAVPAIALAWLAASVDARLALAIAPCFAVIVLLVPALTNRPSWAAARRIAAARGRLAEHLGDDLQGTREVLAFGATASRLEGLDRADRDLASARLASGRLEAVRVSVSTLLQAAAVIAPLLVTLAEGLPPADLVVSLAVAVGLVVPARGVNDFTAGLDAAFAATARVRAVVEATPLVPDSGSGSPPASTAAISLERVGLRYPGAADAALEEVSVDFAPGSWNFVVGVSGSGKSSLAGLLLRGWDPSSGSISLDGRDVRAVPLDALRGYAALVPQRPTLLSGTLATNLRLAAPDADNDSLREALRTVALENWLDELPQGLDTPVGARGATVSGGQLQRLALARGLVARPGLLVLDEALSQLDEETAHGIRERLGRLEWKPTVVEITHRADLVPDASQVVVIDRGRVIERGAAAGLRAASGAFSRLEART